MLTQVKAVHKVLRVTGLTCERCVERVKEAVAGIKGVRTVEVRPNFPRAEVEIVADREIDEESVEEALRRASTGTPTPTR